jgi:hypothetical protein
LTQVWLHKNDIKLNFWQLISLSTSSFVIFQFISPGAPDVLMHIFMLLLITFPFSSKARLSLMTLSLMTHAVHSIAMLSVLSFFVLDKDSLWKYWLINILYMLFWVGGYQFSISGAILAVEYSHGVPAIQLSLTYPLWVLYGMFFTYKLLWVVIITALVMLLRNKQYMMALEIFLLLFSALLVTSLGEDTSKYYGWSFIALLLSFKVVHERAKKDVLGKSINVIIILNLLIPPYFVGLSFTGGGAVLKEGIYKQMISLFQSVL